MSEEALGGDAGDTDRHGSLGERELLESALIELERIAKAWKAPPQDPADGEKPLTDLHFLAKKMGFRSLGRLSKLYSRTTQKKPPAWPSVLALLEATDSDVNDFLGAHGSVFQDAPAFTAERDRPTSPPSGGAAAADAGSTKNTELGELRSELFIANARVRLLQEALRSEQLRGEEGRAREQQLSVQLEYAQRAYAEAEQNRVSDAATLESAHRVAREAGAARRQAEVDARASERARERAQDAQRSAEDARQRVEGQLRRCKAELRSLKRLRTFLLPVVVAIATVLAIAVMLWARGVL